MSLGAFTLVLHSHLPYCKKAGVWPFGEEWVFEALAETYLPVLDMLFDFVALGFQDRIRLAIGFTPVLIDQLTDPYMLGRFEDYLDMKTRLAEDDMKRFYASNEGKLAELASKEKEHYLSVKRNFVERYRRDVVGAFRELASQGLIELVAGAATHAYLPLLRTEASLRIQLGVGVESYRRHFGWDPKGIWLPGCGFAPPREDGPRLADILQDYGIRYFFVDSHAIEGGGGDGLYVCTPSGPSSREGPRRCYTTYLPYRLEDSELVVFGRNERTGLQVWSSEWGYPGDGAYREFHKRDSHSGFHYWRVTSKLKDLDSKEIYVPQEAVERAQEHARHFAVLVERLLREFWESSGLYGITVAPYDMELFGHWWFEGLKWLREVLELLALSPEVELVVPSAYLEAHPPLESISLLEGSWGVGGGHDLWLNPGTATLWEALHREEAALGDILTGMQDRVRDGTARRILNQALRELLILQASDWPFLLTTGQAGDYALSRFSSHRERFERLISTLAKPQPDPEELSYLEDLEDLDGVFKNMDLAGFCGV